MQLQELMRKYKKLLGYLDAHGTAETVRFIGDRLFGFERRRYSHLVKSRVAFHLEGCFPPPLISIVVPVYNPKLSELTACIDSVRGQNCSAWELVVCDDHSSDRGVIDYLRGLEQLPSVRVLWREQNGGIANATNDAIAASTGDYVAFLDNDDTLTVDAIARAVDAIRKYAYDFLYTDEDKLFPDGSFGQPFYKPDCSPELLLSCNYVTHLTVVRRSLGDALGWLRSEFDGSQDYDFALRAFERADKIGHVPEVCYHWRVGSGSVAGNPVAKPYAYDSARKALQEALRRRGVEGTVESHPHSLGHYQVAAQPPARMQITYVLDLRQYAEGTIDHFLRAGGGANTDVQYDSKICIAPKDMGVDSLRIPGFTVLHDMPELTGFIYYQSVPGSLRGGYSALLALTRVLLLSDAIAAVTPSIRLATRSRKAQGAGGEIAWHVDNRRLSKFLAITHMDLNNCTRLYTFSLLFRAKDSQQIRIQWDAEAGRGYAYAATDRRLVTCGSLCFDSLTI